MGKKTGTIVQNVKNKQEKDFEDKKEMAEKVFQNTKNEIIPAIKNKVQIISEEVERIVSNDSGLLAPRIEKLIGNRSISDIVCIKNKTFTSEELLIALQFYKEMIAKINEFTLYPPSKYNFCSFLGITTQTYDNYKQDIDKLEAIRMIDDYIAGVNFTSAQLRKIDTIMTMFGLKSMHGLVEAQAPVVIEHKKEANIDDIKAKIASMKGKIIDAEYEEKDTK